MIKGVHDVFEKGPDAVIAWFGEQQRHRSVDDGYLSLLAQICWTEAATVFETNREHAGEWARAAIVGYKYLSEHASAPFAESAKADLEGLLASKYSRDI